DHLGVAAVVEWRVEMRDQRAQSQATAGRPAQQQRVGARIGDHLWRVAGRLRNRVVGEQAQGARDLGRARMRERDDLYTVVRRGVDALDDADQATHVAG